MSEIDDLEEIAIQLRYSVNDPERGTSKAMRTGFRRAQFHGSEAQRSVEKQQTRSSVRRKVLVGPANQE